MKKIIIPFDGSHFSMGALEFANRLNQSETILLSGVFVPETDFANLWNFSGGAVAGPIFVPLVEDAETELIEKNILRFSDYCEKNQIEFRVHENLTLSSIPEMKEETRFSDLMIIGSEAFYQNMGTDEPNSYLRDTLRQAECPIVIVPESFRFPESILLTYDGSESSVFAIKQFAYLFPQFATMPTLLVTAADQEDEEFPEESNIEELAARHFKDLTFLKLQIDPRKYFATWLVNQGSTMVVAGSYGRSAFSEFVRKSFITEVISTHKVPIFLTHK